MCRPLANLTTDDLGQVLTYDAWNRLLNVASASGTTIKSYAYDGTSQRIEEAAPATNPTELYYDSSSQVLEEDTGTSGAALHTQYVWSPVYVNALILRDYDFTGSAIDEITQRVYVTQDANWNVTSLITHTTYNGATILPDADGEGNVDFTEILVVAQHFGQTVTGGDAVGDFTHDGVVDFGDELKMSQNYGATNSGYAWSTTLRIVYDAYGNYTCYNGDGSLGINFLGMNYTYQGGRQDLATGLIHFDMRDYDPRTYTWMTTDPLQLGPDFYEPFEDNPINRLDPTGTTTTDALTKFFGGRVKKAYGLAASAITQFKIWGLGGVEAGGGAVAIFFADTSEIAIYSIVTGLGKALRDGGGAAVAGGTPFEGGAQGGVGIGPEVATMSGGGPADAASYAGAFHTVQAGVTIPIPTPWGPAPTALGAGFFWSDIVAGSRWWGGGISVGPGIPGTPNVGGGTVDWDYKLISKVTLTAHGKAGSCAYYALLTAMPDLPNLA